jgi:hypothetical protein
MLEELEIGGWLVWFMAAQIIGNTAVNLHKTRHQIAI